MKKKVSIIVPCLNEEKNIKRLYLEIKKKFRNNSYEVIFVDDDSTDDSQIEIINIHKKYKNIKYIFRKNDKDISRSFFEGLIKSKSEYAILMDCDLQHDPRVLNKLFETIKINNLDCVSGSRFMKKSINNTKKFKYTFRFTLSKILNFFINTLFGINLSDPLTGIFIVKRKTFLDQKKKLYLNGYKVFLDFYLSSMEHKNLHTEIPIKINERIYGESKVNLITLINILKLIFIKFVNNFFLKFQNK